MIYECINPHRQPYSPSIETLRLSLMSTSLICTQLTNAKPQPLSHRDEIDDSRAKMTVSHKPNGFGLFQIPFSNMVTIMRAL